MQFEVLVPRVSPGIEEPDRATGTVDGCDIRAFVPIAEDTGVGQIAYTRGAAVFAADDVIDLMRKARAIRPDSIRNVDAHARSRAGARRRLHSRATGQDLPGARFSRPEDMFQIHDVIQFRLLLG